MDDKYITYEEMYNSLNEENLDIKFTSKNVVKNPMPLKDKVNENYKFVNKNIFYRFFSFIFYFFAFLILYPALKIFYLPKIKGKKNIKNIKNAVYICNHTFILDSAVINTQILKFRRPYIIATSDNLRMPVVKTMVRLFKAVPIPKGIKAYKKFLTEVDYELKNKKSILIYPEGSMWPYYSKIRPFNSGAFRFSIKNNVPVVPICISFRKPNKFYSFFKRKSPLININILEPVYPNIDNDYKTEENRMNSIIYKNMNDCFTENNTYTYINKKKYQKNK